MKRLTAFFASIAILLVPMAAMPQCIVPANGAVVKTTSYTALAADTGKLIIMNCASACTLTLPSTPQTPVWQIWTASIGAGAASVSPNGLHINGSLSNVTIPYGIGEGFMISTDNTDYFAAGVNPGFYAAGGGTAQAQTVTLNPPVGGLTTGLFLAWLPVAANTSAAPTLAVNGLTAKNITKNGTTALVANDLTTTAVAYALYDGTQFQLLNPQTSGGGGDMLKNSANTMGASGTIDNSAETGANAFKVPVQAGAAPTADGAISVNSTTHLPNVGVNGATTTLIPADPTNVIYERDDFIGQTNTGIFGHGWTVQGGSGTGAAATNGVFTGDVNHPFGVRITSGATSGNFSFFTPHGNATAGGIANSVGADFWFIFRLEQAATAPQQEVWVGFRDTQTAIDPTNGIFLRTVGTTAKANYFFVCRAAGVETTVDSTVLMDTAIHKLRIHVNSSSSISFTLDAGTTQTITTNVPSAALSIGIDLTTSEAVNKAFDMYNFTFLQPVSR